MPAEQRIQAALDVSKPAGKVLAETIEREIMTPFEWADAAQTMDRHGLTANQYKAAVKELLELGVVEADTSVYHSSGFARTRLEPTGFLDVAPALLPDVDIPAEITTVIDTLHHAEDPRALARDILEETGLPVGRFDLYVRALRDRGMLTGSGPASAGYGSFLYLELTDRGRAFAAGEEDGPIPGGGGDG